MEEMQEGREQTEMEEIYDSLAGWTMNSTCSFAIYTLSMDEV